MIKVICHKCSVSNNIKFKEEFCGKLLSVKCKNPKCEEVLQFIIPKPQPKTIVLDEKSDEDQFIQTFIDHEEGEKLNRFPLSDSVNIIGRKSDDSPANILIQTEDTSVSRKHCVIEKIEMNGQIHFILSDCGSKNGVFLNGEKLDKEDEIYLQSGDVIYLGLTKLNFMRI
jgi:pSer/pThr/pTyr-binding forkhead associated (FHA) protein